jgi:hypothetical protein
MWALLRFARTATMGITHTLARLMAITALTTLWEASSSARVHGSMAFMDRAGTVADGMATAGAAVGIMMAGVTVGSMGIADSAAGSMAAVNSMAEMASTAEATFMAVAASTEAVGFTVGEASMAEADSTVVGTTKST